MNLLSLATTPERPSYATTLGLVLRLSFFSFLPDLITSLLRCWLFPSPPFHTFLRRFINSLHISITSDKPYPLLHSDCAPQKKVRNVTQIQQSCVPAFQFHSSLSCVALQAPGPGPHRRFPLRGCVLLRASRRQFTNQIHAFQSLSVDRRPPRISRMVADQIRRFPFKIRRHRRVCEMPYADCEHASHDTDGASRRARGQLRNPEIA